MTTKARQSFSRKLAILVAAALLCFVLALQLVSAPVLEVASKTPVSAYSYGNGVNISYNNAESGYAGEDYTLSDSSVESQAAMERTPAPSDEVTVIVTVGGTPMMQFATAKNMSVAEAMATKEGMDNLEKLNAKRSLAKESVSKYIIDYGFEYSTITNAFSATVKYGDVNAIRDNKNVESVILSNTYLAPQTITENYVDVYETGIFNSSGVGYDGTGTVIAVADTGTDYTHEVFDMELDADTLALTKDDVAALVPVLAATAMSAARGEVINEDDLYLKSKLPFAYDYADADDNVYPREAHGTHVAGIIAGESDTITGVAPRAQIVTLKVFSDYGSGAKTEWILAGLNDAVTLGVDAINMSLGSSCGFSREVDEEEINKIYDSINDAGICLVVAAGNEYSSAQGSTWGNTNLATNPDSGTVGSPGSYTASLSVGSVSGVKTKYFMVDDHEIYFAESRLVGKVDSNNFVDELLGDKSEGEYEYVVVPGVGMSVNYTGIDVTGKIAVIKRGNNSFEEKIKIAMDKGAIAVVCYNNISGSVNMSVGTKPLIPSCFVSMDLAEPIVASGTGIIKVSKEYLAGPFMSDFSCWGVLPDMTLVPDITAHGGEIYSSVPGGDQYQKMNGTSMACPNLAGALILVRQYVKEHNPEYTAPETRDESYSRMMSTGTIVRNEYGNPYSPRKQGAGIADISHSINTMAYLTVDGSNKPKLSLGDDPARTGEYTMKFNIVNTSNTAISYNMGAYVMTESMSIDERTVAERAYMFDDTTKTYSINAKKGKATKNGNSITVSGYGEAEITVTIKLSANDKKYLNDTFRNGMFVEGYILLDSNNLDGIDLNIPFLAFYGDWTDAPMLDVTAYEVGESNADDSVIAEEKLKPDIYGSLPLAGFASASAAEGIGYTGIGSFAYILAEGYTAPETQEKFAALTTNPDGDYLLYGIAAGLFRGAKRVEWDIRNSATGELVKNGTAYNARKSHSSGGEQSGGFVKIELDMRTLDLPNNSKYTFSMSCYLDWKDENGEYTYGNKNTFSFEFTVDNEAPVLNDVAVRKDDSGSTTRYYLDLTMFDNHYLQCYAVYTYEGIDADNNITGVTTLAKGGVIPANGEFNRDNTLTLDISQYWSQIQANGGKLYLTAYDYAKNMSTYEIVIQEEADLQISKTRTARDEYTVVPNGQIELSDYITVRANTLDDVDEDGKSYLEGYWTKDLIWESSDPDSVEVDRHTGLVTGIKENKDGVLITVRTPNVAEFREDDLLHCLSFTIKVEGEPTEIALSGIEMYVYKVDANGDLITDDNGDPIEVQSSTLSLERGEYAVIGAKTKPYNFTGDVTLEWTSTSSNVRIEKIAEDGMSAKIFAAKSGSATIRATVSGSRISGYTSVRVLNEFIVESVYLRSYTGRGGDWVNEDGEVEHNVVEIPDDLGIVYIYPRAFQGNQYIKKVIIPEGVMIVMKYAFTNCPSLEEVVLPSSVETLEEYAFYQLIEWDDNSDEPTYLGHLAKINLENVKSIGRLAFHGCKMEEVDFSKCTYIDSTAFMYCTELKSVDLSRVGTVGGGAFAFCTSLTELVIPENTTLNSYAPALVRGYLGAFYGCTGLETVEIRSKSVGDMAFAYCENLTTVTFTGDMDFIGDQAFLYCTALTDVNFNGTLYSIGEMAFFGCLALPSITLPAGLTEIGSMAFGNDRALTTVRISSGALLETLDPTSHTYFTSVQKFIVEDGNKYLASDDYGILYDRAYKKIIAFPFNAPYSGMTVPASVTTIGKGAFSGAWYLSEINLNNVEYIEENAFADMIQLTSVTGTKVKYIGDYAFYATDITSLPISDSTTYIGDYAFAGCDALTSTAFNAPAKLSYLGDYAFAGIEYAAYDGTQETRIVPLTTVTFSNDVKSLGEGIFQNCTDLSEVDLTGLTRLSANMFVGCTALTSINVPSSVKSIGEGVFEGCSELSSVTLSDKLTSIPSRAFYNTALISIVIPQEVTSIGTRAFAGTDLTSIELANTDSESKRTVSIGSYAFSATKLTSVSSSIVNSVGMGAFSRCTELTTVNLAGATSIANNAFANCTSLATVTLTSAKEIGERAFAGCTALTAITLPNAETLGNSVFDGAENLASVTLAKVKTIGSDVFAGTAVTAIDLPVTIEKITDGAFNGAESLSAISVDEANKKFVTDNGVLYSVTDKNYYVLMAYPAGKADLTEYSVLDRTIRLAAYSFSGNDTLTKMTLPVHLQVIGISAMSGMSRLNEIVINATEAPTLESRSWVEYERDESGEIATDNWGSPLYTFMNQYDNFNFVFDPADETEHNLKITVPANNNGYFNSRIWKLYVGKYIEVSDKAHATLATLNFIERVKALPTNPTAADAEEIAALLRIYNMFNTVQSYIVLGRYGDYNDNGVTIDADYYEALLQGKNYYSILTAAQNSLPAAVVSAMNAELYGTSATVTTDTMRNVVIALFGIALIVAVAVFASKFNKRRGLK